MVAIAAGGDHTVALAGCPIDFATQAVSTASEARTFMITNTGTAPLNISSVGLVGGNAADFTVNTAGMLTSLPATTGGTTFTVTFNPNVTGARKATLRVVSNDSDESIQDIILTGTGTAAPSNPEIAVTGNSVSITDGDSAPTPTDHTDFGSATTVSGNVTRSFTIANTGVGPLTLGTVTVSGADASNFIVTTLPSSPVNLLPCVGHSAMRVSRLNRTT